MNRLYAIGQGLDWDFFCKGFLSFSVVCFLLLPVDFLLNRMERQDEKSIKTVSMDATGRKIQAITFYESVLDQDTFFGKILSKGSEKTIKVPLSERVKDYRLKGVFLSETSEAIFEDARTQKAFFVQEGGAFDELQVKKIQEGKVTLGIEAEEITLEIQ